VLRVTNISPPTLVYTPGLFTPCTDESLFEYAKYRRMCRACNVMVTKEGAELFRLGAMSLPRHVYKISVLDSSSSSAVLEEP